MKPLRPRTGSDLPAGEFISAAGQVAEKVPDP